MTPGMQIRLWLRSASRGQVGATLGVLALVLVLLASSLSRGSSGESTDALGTDTGAVTDGAGQGGTTGSSAPGTGGTTGGPAGGTAGGATGGATSGGSGGSSGSSGTAFGSPSGTSGGVTSGTSGSAGTTGSSGSAGGSGSSGGGTSGATTGGRSADVSKATDRGINNCSGGKPCVKLGVLIAKIGGLDQSGFALNVRGDLQKVVQALIDDQNKKGGINGRAIVPVFRDTDPIDEGDQQQACTQLTSDDKVFGVIDTQSFIFANPQKCLTQVTATPYVHGYAESEAFMDAGKGYDVSETRSLDRIAVEWADEIGTLGFLKGGETVGVLEDNCQPSNSVVEKLLLPGIRALKVKSVKTYESDCSAAYAQSQPPALAQQMCVDGVTHVVLATSFVAAQTFLQAADGGPCGSGAAKFRYMASDYSLLANDLFTRNFNKQQFDGSLAITNFYTGIAKGSPQQASCSAVLKAAGLPGLDNSYTNADANAMCDYFAIFVKAAIKAGPNLTRPGWAQAVQSLGTFEGAFSPRSVFAPGKTSGGELVHAMVWKADCTCYRQTGPLHVGKG